MSEARSFIASPWEDRRYSTSRQALRPAHHSTNQRPSIPLLLWAGQGAVMGHWSTLSPFVVVVVTVDRGRILGRNWEKSLKRVFLLAIHSHLYDKSENSQDYAQKPQRNCTFMNSASGLFHVHDSTVLLIEQWCLKIGSTNTTCPLPLHNLFIRLIHSHHVLLQSQASYTL